MNPVVLHRIDPTKRMHRYYRMDVQPDLFGQWCLMREWGRIGSTGQTRCVPFSTPKEADRDGNGVVTADELIDYVRAHVIEHTRGQPGGQQTPTENQDFDADRMILAFNARRAAEIGLQTGTGEIFVTSNVDSVEFHLNDKPMGIVSIGTPLHLSGIAPGSYTVKGVKTGYDSDGPRDIVVYPGRGITVPIRIQYARKRKKSALLLFENGLKFYEESNSSLGYRRAAELFGKALSEDPHYSEAALYLARAYQMLEDHNLATRYHKKALELDPDYIEAHISYASVLLDSGDLEEAARQLRYAINRDPRQSQSHSHLAYVYRLAESYHMAVEEAEAAIRLDSSNAQAYLCLADSMRALNDFEGAQGAYLRYAKLTELDPTFYENIRKYMLGSRFYNIFTAKRASQKTEYRDQRNQGYFGLCACEEKLGNLIQAAKYCNRALKYDADDPYSYYVLGRINIEKYNLTLNVDSARAAVHYFDKVLAINSGLEESKLSREYLTRLHDVIRQSSGTNDSRLR